MFEHFFDANSPFAGLVYCRWPMPLHGLAAAGPFRWECFLRRTPLTGLLGITPRACQMSALQTQLQAASAHRPATRSNPGMVTAHGSARRTGAAAHSNLRGKVSTKLLDQERELSRRKPSLLCLRLKLAKQGCFHPRDVLPKQSTASAGFRMAVRPLGQRITGDPRGARVDRATSTGPVSPPSASNRVPAPVVDLGRALGRGKGGGSSSATASGNLLEKPARRPAWVLEVVPGVSRREITEGWPAGGFRKSARSKGTP